jgi:hypothetical protein
MQLLPGHGAPAYEPCTAQSPRQYLRLDQTQLNIPQGAPMNDARLAADRTTFHNAVIGCPDYAGLNLAPDHFRKFLAVDAGSAPFPAVPAPVPPNSLVDPGANGVSRFLGDGLFAMYQITDDTAPGLPLCWGWIPTNAGALQVWRMIAQLPLNSPPYWHRPSAVNMPISKIWIEYVQATPPGNAWDIVNNQAVALASFENWIRTTWPAHAGAALLDPQFMRAADVT